MAGMEAKNFGIELKASVASRNNAVFHANSVPAIAEIEIINNTEQTLRDVSVLVSSSPGCLKPGTADRISKRGSERLNPVPVELDPAFLLWTGLATALELVAALVRPNDPTTDAVLRNAAGKFR